MSRVISISEVNKHQNKNSVWMVIHNDVYDVTKFLDEHPGGEEALLDYAGKVATQAFEDVGHSEDARELLKKFKIGTLPEDERDKGVPPTIVTQTWGSNWKWYVLALLGAIAIGVLLKKKMAA